MMKRQFKGVWTSRDRRTWFAHVPLLDGSVSTPARDTQEAAARDYDNVIYYCAEWITCSRAFNFPAEWADPNSVPAASEATLKIKAKIATKLEEGNIDPSLWNEARDMQRWRERQKDARAFRLALTSLLQSRTYSITQINALKQQWEELIFEIERHAV